MTSFKLLSRQIPGSGHEIGGGLVKLKVNINTTNVMQTDCLGVVKPAGMLGFSFHGLKPELRA